MGLLWNRNPDASYLACISITQHLIVPNAGFMFEYTAYNDIFSCIQESNSTERMGYPDWFTPTSETCKLRKAIDQEGAMRRKHEAQSCITEIRVKGEVKAEALSPVGFPQRNLELYKLDLTYT